MRCLAQYMQLLAQRKDFDNWVNILFVVMIAIFWLVGGLVKAMAKKAQDRQQPGTEAQPKPLRRPADFRQARSRKPPPVPSGVRPPLQPKLRRQPEGAARPRPAAYKPDDSRQKPDYIPAVDLAVQPEKTTKVPHLRIDLPEHRQLSSQFIEQSDLTKAATLTQKPRFAAASLSFLDISNPQELRRAIMHYEILGKPLALRGPHSPPW
jgi:hypothetical protein